MKNSPFKPKAKIIPPPSEPPPGGSTNTNDRIEGTVDSLPWESLTDADRIQRCRRVIHQMLQTEQRLNERISRLEQQMSSHNHMPNGQVMTPLWNGLCGDSQEQAQIPGTIKPWF